MDSYSSKQTVFEQPSSVFQYDTFVNSFPISTAITIESSPPTGRSGVRRYSVLSAFSLILTVLENKEELTQSVR